MVDDLNNEPTILACEAAIAREAAIAELGYSDEDGKSIRRGDFDDKWDCLRVARRALSDARATLSDSSAVTK